MKRFVLGLGCLAGLVLAPSIASAALTLDIGPKHGTGPGAIDAPPVAGPQALDLIFTEVAPTENEGLFAYDLLVQVPTGMRDLITLTDLVPADNFVFGNNPGAEKYSFTVADRAADHILANISSNNDLFDVTSGKTAGRVLYTLTPLGLAQTASDPKALIMFDQASTVFGSGDPNYPGTGEITVIKDDAGVIGVPEPTSLSLLGLAGLLALRRRRTA